MEYERVIKPPPAPHRSSDSHKGTYGRLLIIAGGRGMAGAAALAGISGLRGGAGLVHLAVPESIVPVVCQFEPSYLVAGLPEDAAGFLNASARSGPLAVEIQGKDALAVGPGLGQSVEITRLIEELNHLVTLPIVFDADALNAIAKNPASLSKAAGPRILTPHPGEFSRLINLDTKTVQANREEYALVFAQRHEIILLLKGHRTIITDGERLAINETGNPGMATGGCGDVLTGLIGALLAQGMTAFDAAHLGAYLHGLAGDLAARELSQPGLIASDLPHFVARAWRTLGS